MGWNKLATSCSTCNLPNGVGRGRGVTARRYIGVLVPVMAGPRGMVSSRTPPDPTAAG